MLLARKALSMMILGGGLALFAMACGEEDDDKNDDTNNDGAEETKLEPGTRPGGGRTNITSMMAVCANTESSLTVCVGMGMWCNCSGSGVDHYDSDGNCGECEAEPITTVQGACDAARQEMEQRTYDNPDNPAPCDSNCDDYGPSAAQMMETPTCCTAKIVRRCEDPPPPEPLNMAR